MNTARTFLLGGLSIFLLGSSLAGCAVRNPMVLQEIERNPNAFRAERTLILTLPTGERFPVNYLREGDVIYLGADGRWWRNFIEPGTVSLFVRGDTVEGVARAVRDRPELRKRVFKILRPQLPSWLPQWVGGVLVQVDLQT